jgi:hypothetical protein
MHKKTKLDQEFNDCTKVEINVISDQQKIKLTLKDMYERLCVFHFEKMKKLEVFYDDDEADALWWIQSIQMLKDENGLKHFEIEFTFNTKALIVCREFWYETEY